MGSNLTYTIAEINSGPSPAGDVTVADNLPTGVAFVSATSTKRSCTQSASPLPPGGLVSCANGALTASAPGNTATMTIVITLLVSGMISNTAGGGHSLAVLADGTVKAWGRNADAELGIGKTSPKETSPQTVSGLNGVVAVAVTRTAWR